MSRAGSNEEEKEIDPLDAYLQEIETQLAEEKSTTSSGPRKRKDGFSHSRHSSSSSDEEEENEALDLRPLKLARLDNRARRLLNLPLQTPAERKEARRKARQDRKRLEAEARRNAVTRIPEHNIGFQMLRRMGYEAGKGLGKSGEGRVEPVSASLKLDRTGLGVVSEERERHRLTKQEILERRAERRLLIEQRRQRFATSQSAKFAARQTYSLLRQARSVLHNLEQQRHEEKERNRGNTPSDPPPLNLLWGLPTLVQLLQDRELLHVRKSEASALMREFQDPEGKTYSMPVSAPPGYPSVPGQQDAEEAAARIAAARQNLSPADLAVVRAVEAQVPDLLPGEIVEMERQLPFPEIYDRLVEVLTFLRDEYFHCVYCGRSYSDLEELENTCPGLEEDDH